MRVFQIHIAAKHGFCSGVRRAITLTEQALAGGEPVVLLHELVHNNAVSAYLTHRGARVVDTIDEVPDNVTLVTSAHGIPAGVAADIRRRKLKWVDATCPIVARIHELSNAVLEGDLVVLIGHGGHPETIGTLGQHPGRIHLVEKAGDVSFLPELLPGQGVRILTQTTLSAAELEAPMAAIMARYPGARGGDCRCYATGERQDAVRELAGRCDCVLVVGTRASSNSCRLREVAEAAGVRAMLVEDPATFDLAAIEKFSSIGVTSGASVPESQLQELICRLEAAGGEPA